ncbi:MAG: hypothetical protein QOJ15_58, partial [Bradyrhizobium sp.]|nr:hypothetical protein [Bradyrhizobium sp.]
MVIKPGCSSNANDGQTSQKTFNFGSLSSTSSASNLACPPKESPVRFRRKADLA